MRGNYRDQKLPDHQFMRHFFFIILALIALSVHAEPVTLEEAVPIGAITYHTIQKSETLNIIAAHYGLGLNELLQANPEITDPRIIYAGTEIILPLTHLIPNTLPRGIVINLAEPRLYFFPSKNISEFVSYPITIGKDQRTPTGHTKVAEKYENPSWIPPESIRKEDPSLPEIIPPGPENPLGAYVIGLDATKNRKWVWIKIHGTNQSWTIGTIISHGCIRLYPKDIKALFEAVKIGTPVRIVNQVLKVSEIEGKVYLEAHLPGVAVVDPVSINGTQAATVLATSETELTNSTDEQIIKISPTHRKFICRHIKNCEAKIDWEKAGKAIDENLGIPVEISYEPAAELNSQ